MKAAVLYSPGDFRVENRPVPQIKKDDDVLISVSAVGICGSDIDRIFKTGMYTMPAVPGHEFCGIVKKTGKNVKKFKEGDRVAVAPILPCFKCESCLKGNYGQCDNYDYLGSRRDGAFAEYVVAPERNLVKMAENVDMISGGAIEPACVTLHGMMKTGLSAGDSVAVIGCGAIGLFAIQFAKILGATKIIAVDILQNKLEAAKKAGATDIINSIECDPIKAISELTSGGVDISVETAGSPITQEQCVRAARKHGVVLLLGTAHKDVVFPPKTFEHIIRNELTLKGTWNSFSSPFPGREWTAVAEYLADERFDIKSFITHVITLDELPQTLLSMKNREFEYNKVVVKIS